MIYTALTKKAMRFAYEAHAGVYDKGGVPYVFHPFHVAEQMNSEYDVCVALMHDVVEDTNYTIEYIKELGFPDEIVEAVDCLTRRKGQDYMEYIRLVKQNPMAVRVKLADIEHNSDVTRIPEGEEKYFETLHKRYAQAKKILEE
jgi:(p)ppGpp synthase/HD superfamily hydrolase